MNTPIVIKAALVFTIFSIFIPSFLITPIEASQPKFAESLNPKLLRLKKEKLTHIHLYFQDIVTGPKTTAQAIVRPRNDPTGFGLTVMIDDALTIGPELDSKLVGRAEGLYAVDSLPGNSLLVAMNFLFLEGKYNGSTISILGRNAFFDQVREMPIVGGSGIFRFAKGYVEARTHTFNLTSGDATVEYNIYVLHY